MTYTVKLSDPLVSGSRREVSRIFFDPVKVARLLGFDVEVDNKGFVARAAIAGKTIKVEKMESILEHISYSYYDMISRKLDFDALPPVDIFQTFGIRVVDDVNDKPRALQANELSLSALLACGEPFRTGAQVVQTHDMDRLEPEFVHLERFDLLHEFAHRKNGHRKAFKDVVHCVSPLLNAQRYKKSIHDCPVFVKRRQQKSARNMPFARNFLIKRR